MQPFENRLLGIEPTNKIPLYASWDGILLTIHTLNSDGFWGKAITLTPLSQVNLVNIFEKIVKGDPTDLTGVRHD